MRSFNRNAAGDIDFGIVDELESARQRVVARLQLWRGEWFIDREAGVPYIQDILGKRADEALVKRTITEIILTVPGVEAVEDIQVTMPNPVRQVRYAAHILTIYGGMDLDMELV